MNTKVKVLDQDTDNPLKAFKSKAKFTSLVSAQKDDDPKQQLALEHCQVRFLTGNDRENFINIFTQQQEQQQQ